MKKLLFVGMCLAALAACTGGDKWKNMKIVRERDSLLQVIGQRDAELNDILTAMNEIEEGMLKIGGAEERITIAKQGEGASQTQRIQEDMEFIQTQLEENRKLMESLQAKLRNSTVKNSQLQKALDKLSAQIEEKDKALEDLRNELSEKNIHIARLGEAIDSLNTNVNALQEETKAKTEVIMDQEKRMHTAWFVYGTKSELKSQKILSNGKVLQGDFNRNYFTEIDIRADKEIKLYSKSAELLTSHPSDSYTLQRDENKQYVLTITNAEVFWSTSRYLVVQVK